MADSTDSNTDPNNPAATATPAAGAPAAVDVQAQINQALAAQRTEFANQLKAATGHDDIKSLTDAQLQAQGKLQELADNKTKEAATYKQQYQQVNIANSLLAASADAIDPAVINALLSPQAVCDEAGNVTIGGRTVSEAVKQLLADKPYLAKAQGGPGSGTPQQAGTVTTKVANESISATQRLADAYQSQK